MKQIVVSGFGGQGVISMGLLLAHAAMEEGKNTSFLPSYGPEMRGGTANCSVVISEKEVASPVISRPDILVAFNAPSLDRFLPALAENGCVFVDESACKGRKIPCGLLAAVPLGKLCGDNAKGQNIVMLGAMLAQTGLPLSRAEDAVREGFARKPQFIDANLRCLHAGAQWAQKEGLA